MDRRRFPHAGSVAHGWLLALVACAGVISACGDPPDKEIQQAETAIASARTLGAETYAPDEFQAAVRSLKQAHDAVEQRDYRLALNDALDSRERALAAVKLAIDQKAVVRAAAEQSIRDAATALTAATERLKAIEALRQQPRGLAEARRAVRAADDAVQEARTAFLRDDYLAASQATQGLADRLRATMQGLEAALPARPVRRRR